MLPSAMFHIGGDEVRKTAFWGGVFPMFVPSLSWQNDPLSFSIDLPNELIQH
jgi:N-acetyl-beta-hexosaminidase